MPMTLDLSIMSLVVGAAGVIGLFLFFHRYTYRSGLDHTTRALIQAGLLLHGRGNKTTAISVFLEASKIQPGNPVVLHYLHQATQERIECDAVMQAYQAFLKETPMPGSVPTEEVARARYNLGLLLLEKGDSAKARREWEEVARTDDGGWKDRANEMLAKGA